MYDYPYFKVISEQSSAPPEIPYGIQMIGAQLEWLETKGAGIKVAIIDTGAPTHPDVKVVKALDFSGSGNSVDKKGHGSHVAGTIAANGKIKGVAPEVELYCLKVSKDQGSGIEPQSIANALNWCADNGMDVVNLSLGGPYNESVIEQAAKRCHEKGIVLVAAAGNWGMEFGVLYPARYSTTIATAAVDLDKKHPDWSAVGKELDVAAAGVQVWSTWLNDTYALLDGTSMATPHITGAVALIQAKAKIRYGRKLTPDQIKMLLQMYSEDVGQRGPDDLFGFGVFSFGRIGGSDRIKKEIKMRIGSKLFEVDGQQKEMDVVPFLKDGRTFVPVRFVSEGVGGNVNWDKETQEIDIKI